MAPVDPTTIYLVFATITAVTLILIAIVCKSDKADKKDGNVPRRVQAAQARDENLPPGARRRGPRRRMQQTARDDSDGEADDSGGEDADELFDDIDQPEGKIGTKKLRKLQDKAEKKKMREAELQEREEKKQREARMEEQRKKEAAKREEEEKIRAEEERIRKEEEAKREHEEYLLLKEAFVVEEEGENEAEADLDEGSLLQEFIDYIKDMKVVMLEELAAHFKLKTQDAIQRVQDLQAEGRLTGVVDDRGKFIYIKMEELEAVAKYIHQHGRVSISDLADSSNRLINLNPDNASTRKKLLSEVAA